MEDVYRPINFAGHWEAVRAGTTTVFVRDTDTVTQVRDRARDEGLGRKIEARAYGCVFDQFMRYGVKTASLSLLKGRSLYDRYAQRAKNPQLFHNTSFLARDIKSQGEIRARLEGGRADRPLRLVYCGRLIARKGIDVALRAVAEAKRRKATVTFDIIGDGPERAPLKKLASELELGETITFYGAREYNKALLNELGKYDILLFTPSIEDTPRMIFDGYAAGLPLLGTDIDYIRERIEEERAGWVLPRGSVGAIAEKIVDIDRDRSLLHNPTWAAWEAAHYHAADEWYRRRAEWTVEAYERDHCASTTTSG
jgi:glycosyltransferase involved in cell wall biosynthesis